MPLQPVSPYLSQVLADQRLSDLRAEADRARIVRLARASRSAPAPFALVRRLVGSAMVRAGERLQDARPVAVPNADVAGLGAHLRLAR